MDFDSPDPDVEKEFPGLYASASGGKKKEDSDFSDDEKLSKKELLIGRKKDKKDKKDRGYGILEGDSSPEEEVKSPSKSMKKVKAFKFPSKSKEKREKSRDKEKTEYCINKDLKELLDEKKKKDKKEKDKKEKVKLKDKKLKQTGSIPSEEVLDLGDVQPIFGVSLGLSVERSRCHDGVNLPLVVRDCIDYLQLNGLVSDQIYKLDTVKTRLIALKKLYNNRESSTTEEFDVPVACGLLKLFLTELPEPLLTTDLLPRFEEAASLPDVTEQENELLTLINQLPSCNRILISWLIMHFDQVTENEKANKINAQNLAMLLSPSLQMSHRLLVTLLCYCTNLFENTKLTTYVPPLTASSPNWPETTDEILKELRKQESLLSQIHAEMNAGFVSKKREEQLWEVQRIITQLKRKLRSFSKKNDSIYKSVDDNAEGDTSIDLTLPKTKSSCSDDESSMKTITVLSAESTATNTDTKNTPQEKILEEQPTTNQQPTAITGAVSKEQPTVIDKDKIILSETGLLLLSENHPEYLNLIRSQLENLELIQWKTNLQTRINMERSELVKLRQLLACDTQVNLNDGDGIHVTDYEIKSETDEEYDKIISQYMKENALLEHKRDLLARDIFEETAELIQLQVELNLQKYKI